MCKRNMGHYTAFVLRITTLSKLNIFMWDHNSNRTACLFGFFQTQTLLPLSLLPFPCILNFEHALIDQIEKLQGRNEKCQKYSLSGASRSWLGSTPMLKRKQGFDGPILYQEVIQRGWKKIKVHTNDIPMDFKNGKWCLQELWQNNVLFSAISKDRNISISYCIRIYALKISCWHNKAKEVREKNATQRFRNLVQGYFTHFSYISLREWGGGRKPLKHFFPLCRGIIYSTQYIGEAKITQVKPPYIYSLRG